MTCLIQRICTCKEYRKIHPGKKDSKIREIPKFVVTNFTIAAKVIKALNAAKLITALYK